MIIDSYIVFCVYLKQKEIKFVKFVYTVLVPELYIDTVHKEYRLFPKNYYM